MELNEVLTKLGELTRFGINLGLQRIAGLLKILGNPQEQIPIIHVGGTNGKGSTLAMLSSILRESGYRVGTFISPHLVSYCERFAINGENIAEERLVLLLEEIMGALAEVRRQTGETPTEFEVLTALAFLYFACEKVDLAVIEVGMGGDIDSTNVVKKPLLSIITNVSFDHQDYLGKSLVEIAEKKSGIIKPGCAILTASRNEEVLQVIRRKAQALQAPLREARQEAMWRWQEEANGGQYFAVRTLRFDYGRLFLPLWGEHQLENAATAIVAAEILQEQGWQISAQSIKQGLAKTKWPGRLEIVGQNPLFVLDGAHNPAGMNVLSQWLARKKREVRRVLLVIGMLDDKDWHTAVELLAPLADLVIITKPNSHRARHWEELSKNFQDYNLPVMVIENLAEALQKAEQEAQKDDLILVTGSLYLLGEVKKIIAK
ncbi:MAG: bifunctional folylpolyglutamate synthase/dihydrofolate synthase [Clostridia bacterium]|nr:bifunctional folylpolyglutamate synthase/dihydrofolate synthase [Clostridia bacterium]